MSFNNRGSDYTEYKYYTTYVDPNFENHSSRSDSGTIIAFLIIAVVLFVVVGALGSIADGALIALLPIGYIIYKLIKRGKDKEKIDIKKLDLLKQNGLINDDEYNKLLKKIK